MVTMLHGRWRATVMTPVVALIGVTDSLRFDSTIADGRSTPFALTSNV